MRNLITSLSLAVLLLAVMRTDTATAQRADSVTRAAPPVPAESNDVLRPPISPRRAFAYSFLLPGYGQTRLGRHKAAVAFMLVEAISIAMIRESAADVHEARRFENDTAVVRYVDDQGNENLVLAAPRFDTEYVHARSAHVEDWIALLIANHLFAGADAFVAAHLWDVPARLGLRILPRSGGSAISASFTW